MESTSVEILYHFTCERCKNWWSIAMEKTGWNPKKMWCPHCGYVHANGGEVQGLDYELFQQ